jgi:hypothetical protein
MKALSRRQITLSLGCALCIALLSSIGVVLSIAQTNSQQSADLPPWQVRDVGPRQLTEESDEVNYSASPERVIENQLPHHLPLKVEIRNLEKEPLLRNLEIKVTNDSKKPIYFLDLDILLPGIQIEGHGIIFPLRYGRMEFVDYDEPVRKEDTPIQPGESYVFTVPKENLEPFESYAASINLAQSEIRRVYLIFQQINFGDGTGFINTGGASISNVPKGQASNGSCGKERGGDSRYRFYRLSTNPSDRHIPSALLETHLFCKSK